MTAVLLPTSTVTGILSHAPVMSGKGYGIGVDGPGGQVIQVIVVAANIDALTNAVKAVWALDALNPIKAFDAMVVTPGAVHPISGPSAVEIQAWLRDVADPSCRNCDGTGLFYGNVHICPCVNQRPRNAFTYSPDDDEL